MLMALGIRIWKVCCEFDVIVPHFFSICEAVAFEKKLKMSLYPDRRARHFNLNFSKEQVWSPRNSLTVDGKFALRYQPSYCNCLVLVHVGRFHTLDDEGVKAENISKIKSREYTRCIDHNQLEKNGRCSCRCGSSRQCY